jgi:hypothetical protein
VQPSVMIARRSDFQAQAIQSVGCLSDRFRLRLQQRPRINLDTAFGDKSQNREFGFGTGTCCHRRASCAGVFP